MRHYSKGFTLLELLAVLVVVGILLGLVMGSMVPQLRRSALAEAQTDLSVQLEKARSAAWRSGKSQTLSWTETSFTATSSNGSAATVVITNGARIVTPQPANAPVYLAPFADFQTVGGGGLRLELVDSSGSYHTTVDAAGVTGKVMRRQVVARAAPIP